VTEVTRAIEDLAREEGVRVIVLQGADGGSFIGGVDIKEMVTFTPDTARAFITALHGLCSAIREAPVPVVAKVRSFALGGGMEVAMACDIRVAEAGSLWGMPETRVGIPSVIEAALLPRFVGMGQAANLVLRGHMVDAEDAQRLGLVEEICDPAGLDARVDRVVLDLLAAGPKALRRQKELLRHWQERPLSEAIQLSIDAFADTFHDDEAKEGFTAFLEKRPASYVDETHPDQLEYS